MKIVPKGFDAGQPRDAAGEPQGPTAPNPTDAAATTVTRTFSVRAHDLGETLLAEHVTAGHALDVQRDAGGGATILDDHDGMPACTNDLGVPGGGLGCECYRHGPPAARIPSLGREEGTAAADSLLGEVGAAGLAAIHDVRGWALTHAPGLSEQLAAQRDRYYDAFVLAFEERRAVHLEAAHHPPPPHTDARRTIIPGEPTEPTEPLQLDWSDHAAIGAWAREVHAQAHHGLSAGEDATRPSGERELGRKRARRIITAASGKLRALFRFAGLDVGTEPVAGAS